MKKKKILIFLVLTMSMFGCGPKSEGNIARAIEEAELAEPTSTPRPTDTPMKHKACLIDETQHKEWETVFCETFDDNSYQWDIGMDPEFGVDATISNGKYRIEYNSANQTGYTTGFSLATPFWESKEFVVNILGEMDSVYKQCTWGIMVNGFFDTGISFDINNQGNYFVTDHNIPSEVYLGNALNGSHNEILWDAPNTITIVAEDELLTFLVNGTVITSYKYTYSNEDNISILLWAAEGVKVGYEFDHILVREK